MNHSRAAHWSIGVVIPAQNEEATIEACVDSVLAAGRYSGRESSLWIVVVADTCTDATVRIARKAIGSKGEVIECNVRSAGEARRLGANAAIEHFRRVNPRFIWLANTDADTCVCRDWLAVHLSLADEGIAGVAGIVRLSADGSEAVHEIYRDTYAIGADGTHSHVHGANIAVRADAYLDVGGWMNRALAEEHCLWRRLRSREWPVYSPVSSVVMTSGRLKGRAVGGFADTLQARVDARHAAT